MLIPGTPFVIFVDDMHGNGKKANEKDLNEIGYEIGQQSKKCPCEGGGRISGQPAVITFLNRSCRAIMID